MKRTGQATELSQKRAKKEEISVDEAKLYDRQIRLWGMDAQQKLRNARILIIGIKGVNAEVVKNLVLAGIGSITILDDGKVKENDLSAQFFMNRNDIGKMKCDAVLDRIKDMNPRVVVNTDTRKLNEVAESFYSSFDIVSMTSFNLDDLKNVNAICRNNNVKFYASDSYGLIGWIFSDLLEHSFVIEKVVIDSINLEPTKTECADTKKWASLEKAFGPQKLWKGVSLKKLKREINPMYFLIRSMFEYYQLYGELRMEKDTLDKLEQIKSNITKEYGVSPEIISKSNLKMIFHLLDKELSPICAIVGGVLAQDIVRVLSGKGQPITNFFCTNGADLSGTVHNLS